MIDEGIEGAERDRDIKRGERGERDRDTQRMIDLRRTQGFGEILMIETRMRDGRRVSRTGNLVLRKGSFSFYLHILDSFHAQVLISEITKKQKPKLSSGIPHP